MARHLIKMVTRSMSVLPSLLFDSLILTSIDVQGMDEGKEPEVIDETCSYCAS